MGRLPTTAAALGLAGVLGLLAACSSAPPAPEGVFDRRNQTASFLDHGRQAFREARYAQALEYDRYALDLATAVDDEAGMAAAWNSVATVQTALGQIEEARAALVLAETYALQSGHKTLILQVAVNRAQDQLATGDTAGARARLRALQPFPATAEGAALDHALGLVEKADGHDAEALAAFDRAWAVNQNLKLRVEAASNRYMKGTIYARQEKWAQAQTEFEAALALDKRMENTLGIGQDWKALGTVALRTGRTEDAYEAYLRASRLFQAAGLADQRAKVLALLAPVAATLGRPVPPAP